MKTTEEVITEFRRRFGIASDIVAYKVDEESDSFLPKPTNYFTMKEVEQFIREALERQEKEIYILHKTLDEVLSLSMMYIGRDKIYEIFDFAFKELKKGWIKGLPVTMTFAEHWKLKTNKPEEKI